MTAKKTPAWSLTHTHIHPCTRTYALNCADAIRSKCPRGTTIDTVDIMFTAGKTGAQLSASSEGGQRGRLKDAYRMQLTVVHVHAGSLGWVDVPLHGQSNNDADKQPPLGSNICILGSMNDVQLELLMKSIFDRCVEPSAHMRKRTHNHLLHMMRGR